MLTTIVTMLYSRSSGLIHSVVESLYLFTNVSLFSHRLAPAAAAATAAKSLQSCPTLCDPIDGSPPGSPVPPWDSPGNNTGVGCHFLLQCMKVKSGREVAQSCPTLSNPMDCSPPGSSVHGFSRQEHWSGLPFPFPMHESEK